MLKIIVAVSDNGVIGRKGELPWRLRDDLKWFKEKTGTLPVVMGRKTYESIVKQLGHPLPNREHIVLTRDSGFKTAAPLGSAEGFLVNYWPLVEKLTEDNDSFVIGGAEIYKLALPVAEELYITRVHTTIEDGDAFFPEWDIAEWELVSSEDRSRDERNEYDFTWEVYKRKVKNSSFIEEGNISRTEQKAVMERIRDAKECPFCLENLAKYHPLPIIREGKHWVVTMNQWPYKNTETHLLLIPRVHVEHTAHLPEGAAAELFEHLDWAQNAFNIKAGALAMRFGEPRFSGATVRHLHAQIVVPDPNAEAPAQIYVGPRKEPTPT